MKGISLREQRLIQENKAMEKVLVEVLEQRDKAKAEILSMERKMIMNYGSKKHVDYKLSLFIDNLVNERNHLEEMVVNQQQIINKLVTPNQYDNRIHRIQTVGQVYSKCVHPGEDGGCTGEL